MIRRTATVIALPQRERDRTIRFAKVQLGYHPGERNRCPGCGRSHWHVGRTSAECAFCELPLPILGTGAPS